MIETDKIYLGDCLEIMRAIPDGSIDLIVTDPPYNINKADWDKIDNYINWCKLWIAECERTLKVNGVLYFFHNQMPTIATLLEHLRSTTFVFRSFITWAKPRSVTHPMGWANQQPDNKRKLRSWFPVCEYVLHYVKGEKGKSLDSRYYNDLKFSKKLKEWFQSELTRLDLTIKDVERAYSDATGRKPYMVSRHYFADSQFEIPTRIVWESVFVPLGFRREYDDLRREYDDLRREYDDLRREYDNLRYTHNIDPEHCNLFKHSPPNSGSKERVHPTQKPLDMIARLVRVSSKPDDIVLDPFIGSGTTAVAAINTERRFIGIEKDEKYYEIATQRVLEAQKTAKEHF